MKIDQDRIQAILKAKKYGYGEEDIPIRKDMRWNPSLRDLITQELSPESRILDVGCGRSTLLLDLSPSFHTGLGIDIRPEDIRMDEEAKQAQGIKNVDFQVLDFPREVMRLQPESYDMVVSMRGPIGDKPEQVQAAHHLLRPDGLLFCEEIAELHIKAEEELFDYKPRNQERIRRVDEVRAMMEQNGFEVRLAADLFRKWIYPDIYAWLHDAWLGDPVPEPDDPRIALLAERNTIST